MSLSWPPPQVPDQTRHANRVNGFFACARGFDSTPHACAHEFEKLFRSQDHVPTFHPQGWIFEYFLLVTAGGYHAGNVCAGAEHRNAILNIFLCMFAEPSSGSMYSNPGGT